VKAKALYFMQFDNKNLSF